MTIVALRRADADDATMVRRARRGDRRARRIFCRRHAARAFELVDLMVDDGPDKTALAAAVLSAVVAEGVAGDDALVRCAVTVVLAAADERGLARLVTALTDVDGRSEAEVADLVGRSPAEIADLRTLAYAAAGAPRPITRECRGWPLAARRDRLTPQERDAANGHLMLCRSCRVRLNEQRQTRDKLLIRGGAVSAVVVADIVSLSLPAGGAAAGSGLASVVMGKAGVAVVGATALAVTVTSAGIALTRHAPDHNAPSVNAPAPRGGAGHGSNGSQPRDAAGSTGTDTTATPPPSTAPAKKNAPVTNVPAVTPTDVPALPVPLQLQLPTALPTLSTPPLPLPSDGVSVPPLPTATALVGH